MKKIGVVALSTILAASVAPSLAYADLLETDGSDSATSYVSENSLPPVVDEDIVSKTSGRFPQKANGTWSFEDGVLTIKDSSSLGKTNLEMISPSKEYLLAATKLVIAGDTTSYTFTKLFKICPNVKELSLPSTYTVLPELASLVSLEKLSFPEGCNISSIRPRAFAWSGEYPNFYGAQFDVLDLSTMPLVKVIPSSAFQGSHISRVIFPPALEEIEATAFVDMKYLESITIPSTVKKLGVGYKGPTSDTALFAYDDNLSTIFMYDTIETVEGPLVTEHASGTTIKIIGTNALSESFHQALSEFPSGTEEDPCAVEFQQVFNVNPDDIEAIDNGVEPVETQWVKMGTGLDTVDAETSNAPVLSCDGYNFTGWYSDAECTTPYDFTAPMEHGAVAYAGWKQVISVDVNYGNGSENGTIVADDNGMIAKPDTDPVRAGYKFAGWFSDTACQTEFDFTKPVTNGTCLYAGWTPVKASVANLDGTKTDLQVKDGGTIAEPMAPTRDGYTFKGWYSDAYCTQEFDFSQPLYDDVTLYSKWEAKTAEQPNGGQGNAETQNNTSSQQVNNASGTDQKLAQTSDAAAGAIPAVAFISAMATAIVAFARKRIARR